ncbi:MAG TPA: multicopper oxidase [Dermatophilaceae bacterium]|nr:multicopper oxidase [Dermatophilaceae bacterium]
MIGRRAFLTYSSGTVLSLYLSGASGSEAAQLVGSAPGGSLDPRSIPPFATPLAVPTAMPITSVRKTAGRRDADYYEISVRQLRQQMLPLGLPTTTVWGYGPAAGVGGRQVHSAPSMTIEAPWNRPVRVKWINELTDPATGRYRPHLFAVDPTLHWANPGQAPDALGTRRTDNRPCFSGRRYVPPAQYNPSDPGQFTAYQGPVPMSVHLHGAVGVGDESDGYPEAWVLPAATNLPADHASGGRWRDFFSAKSLSRNGSAWGPGYTMAHYPNDNRPSTLWYHDHTLGMTRLNVYAGAAGFYIVRGGPQGDGAVLDSRTGAKAVFPGPYAKDYQDNPKPGKYFEIPLAIQDRSFNADGSLFYPDTREFFDGLTENYLPTGDIPPVWNPEFFGNTIIVNGATWPYLTVQAKRYRFRLLNGCQARFLILDFARIPGVRVWQVGNEGGFLAAPVDLGAVAGGRLLMAPAERADVIVDFSGVPLGNHVLGNLGPDEPYGGGQPDTDFVPADPATTGRILQFRVVPALAADLSTPPEFMVLPQAPMLPAATVTRRLALIEHSSAFADGPVAAMLGVLDGDPTHGFVAGSHRMWSDPVSQDPAIGVTEVWELHNLTMDAHPIHIHEIAFEVVDRQALEVDEEMRCRVAQGSSPRPPEPWETGVKDTVIAYPGEVTRVRVRFKQGGRFVWHCHIVEHEDNEMMLPLQVGPAYPDAPTP